MEGFDRPLFPEILPVGMSISGKLFPIALKPFPTREELKEAEAEGSASGEE